MNNQHLLGVINKKNERYENIISVDKANEYKCIGCSCDLILRKGEKNFQSFVHKQKTTCMYFKDPSQTIIVNDALLHLKELLDTNKVTIFSRCSICKFTFESKLPKFDSTVKNGNYVGCMNESNVVCKLVIGQIDSEPENKTDTTLIHQINSNELTQKITTSFATKKVELISGKKFVCDKCVKYL